MALTQRTEVTLPELGLIAGTRGMLGAGIALLLADRLDETQRKAIGWTLVAVGAITTIPLAMEVFGGGRTRAGDQSSAAAGSTASSPWRSNLVPSRM